MPLSSATRTAFVLYAYRPILLRQRATIFTRKRHHGIALYPVAHRPELPAHHQLSQQRWLLEKGPHRC